MLYNRLKKLFCDALQPLISGVDEFLRRSSVGIRSSSCNQAVALVYRSDCCGNYEC
jgi:hypothetical protein